LCVSSGTNDTALRRIQVGSVRLGKQVCSAYGLSSVSMAGSAVGSSTQKRRAISCLKKCCLVSELGVRFSSATAGGNRGLVGQVRIQVAQEMAVDAFAWKSAILAARLSHAAVLEGRPWPCSSGTRPVCNCKRGCSASMDKATPKPNGGSLILCSGWCEHLTAHPGLLHRPFFARRSPCSPSSCAGCSE